jgi:spermidine/putrescine transport system ATP-binding protein
MHFLFVGHSIDRTEESSMKTKMTPTEQFPLQVDNLTKYYEGKPLIKDLSFSVGDREILCLLGPSGSGKSTLLRIIAGLETFEGGRVSWQGKDLSNIPPERRSFGLMFQDYALFPHLSVFENVAFGLRMQHLPEKTIQHGVMAELERVSMSGFTNRRVHNLSGGEQQRIALARTLAPKPNLIMLDEPLGALDRKLREQLTSEIRLILKSAGVPAIYVTHDQDEAFSLADRILLLSEGQIVQLGTPEELYRSPRSRWVANFLGLGKVTQGEIISTKPFIVRTVLGDIDMKSIKAVGNPGTLLDLLVRPDDLCMVGSEKQGVNGIVRTCIYQGDHYQTEVEIKGEVFIIALKNYIKPDSQLKITICGDPFILSG